MGTAKNAFQKISNETEENIVTNKSIFNISSLILCWAVSLKMKSPEAKKRNDFTDLRLKISRI